MSGFKATCGSIPVCPYLDTIKRPLLSYTALPICTTTSSKIKVYMCLVCGEFHQGRTEGSSAMAHALEKGHYVWQAMTDASGELEPKSRFYCLPDNYPIIDTSLSDLTRAFECKFPPALISTLSTNTEMSRDVFGNSYLPGYVGSVDLGKTDYISSAVVALGQVEVLRDYFLMESEKSLPGYIGGGNMGTSEKTLLFEFGNFLRRLWSGSRLRASIDPQGFVKVVDHASGGKFKVVKGGEGGEFWCWLVGALHRAVLKGLGKKDKRRGRTVFTEAFEGKVKVRTVRAKEKERVVEEEDEKNDSILSNGASSKAKSSTNDDIEIEETTVSVPFLQLTVDIPQKPLFKDDSKGGLVIPQENLTDLMKKFDGNTVIDMVGRKGGREKKQYNISHLPPYLVLNLKRFIKTKFGIEKNPTIVTFPVEGVDFKPYVAKSEGEEDLDVDEMKVKDIKSLLSEMGKSPKGAVEKNDLIKIAKEALGKRYKYDLVASIAHDTPTNVGRETASNPITEGSHRVHARHQASNQWFEVNGQKVESVMPQMVAVSEAVVLVFKKQN